MYTLNVYEWPYYMCIQGLLLTLNGLDIMVIVGIYFEYIKVWFIWRPISNLKSE